MTLYAKIQEERDEAAINQLIKTCRKHGISDADITTDIVIEFHLSKEEALDCIKEYDKQLA